MLRKEVGAFASHNIGDIVDSSEGLVESNPINIKIDSITVCPGVSNTRVLFRYAGYRVKQDRSLSSQYRDFLSL